MSAHFTESTCGAAVIELFINMGWPHIYTTYDVLEQQFNAATIEKSKKMLGADREHPGGGLHHPVFV